jgi:hypothetical protein
MPSSDHPYLDRIVQAELDKASTKWGRCAVDVHRAKGYTLVFGLAGDDVQMDMVKIMHRTGHVARLPR